MRSYYPMLSVAAALVALAVPTFLIAWPFPSGPSIASVDAENDASAELRAELRRLGQALSELRGRLDELEQPPAMAAPPAKTREATTRPIATPSNAPRDKSPPPSPLSLSMSPDSANQPPATTQSSVAAADPTSREAIVIPHPAAEPSEPREPQPGYVANGSVVNTLPLDSSHLLIAANPTSAASPRASDAAFPSAAGHPDTVNETPQPMRPKAAEPSTAKKKASSRKPTARTARTANSRPNTQPAAAMPPDFGAVGANQLDQWDDQPSFDLSITRPAAGIVRHWEEFVATTNVPGWPVVMVRSETEGDHWWVQQLVARQGNVIAAKVSFGNEETIPGHQFEIVVLLLDSSSEAVRFRTARKFKELPDGVKRSVVYRYVRR